MIEVKRVGVTFGCKLLLLVCVLVFFGGAQIFAQGKTINDLNSAGLNNVFSIAISFFTGWYTKIIAGLALGGLGFGVIMNRGEPGLVKKFIPWIVGCIIILSIGPILNIIGFDKTPPNGISEDFSSSSTSSGGR